ncbi:DUF4252 domain-containing protein [candidate division KSB1 bacterium]|nr:DUF4252 domain-containing protein [candidate division KSB1 bacterium]
MKKLTIVFMLFIFCIPFVSAQDYTKHPGYVDFGDLDELQDVEETVEVFIRGPLLRFVSKATRNEDPNLADLLDGLLLIRVHAFEVTPDNEKKVNNLIKDISNKLEGKKWERMVRVRKRDEKAEIFTQFGKNDELTGLVVLGYEDRDEAVFVNIVGRIDPEQLGKLSGKFNIPSLDSVEIEYKNKKE